MLRLFAHERSKPRGAQEQRLAFVVRARVGGIPRRLGETFGPEGLSWTRDPGNEAASRANSAPQHDSAARHDEHSVCRSAPLIDYETRGPRCACRVRNQRLTLGLCEPRRPKIRLPHNHPRVPQQDRERAMSGPLLTGGEFPPSLDLTLFGGVLGTARHVDS